MLIENTGELMIKILRLSDRVKLKVGTVTFILAPLSNDKKMEVRATIKHDGGEQVFDHGMAQHLYIKYSLKDLLGVEDYHGDSYKLEFEGDYLTDECVSEICNLSQKDELMSVGWQILNGMPDKVYDLDSKVYKRASLDVVKREKPGG